MRRGRPPKPKNYTRITITMPNDLLTDIDLLAEWNRSEFIVQTLRRVISLTDDDRMRMVTRRLNDARR